MIIQKRTNLKNKKRKGGHWQDTTLKRNKLKNDNSEREFVEKKTNPEQRKQTEKGKSKQKENIKPDNSEKETSGKWQIWKGTS